MKQPTTHLDEYAAKRDFDRSKEPRPRVAKPASKKGPLFVIQKHAARHLHYDFRLEMDGVLKSWAVPKGLPVKRADKRLAMHVEDHPFDYAQFEGIIAEGNYGAGTVMVWDIGTYEVSGENPLKALEEGKLHLTLHGKKLNGSWTLVKIRHPTSQGKDPWLLFKSGEDAPPLSEKQEDESAITGRNMQQIAAEKDREWGSSRAAETKAKLPRHRAKVSAIENLPPGELGFVPPMNCRLIENLPAGKYWGYEIKFDGIRAIAIKDGERIQIYSRLGNDITGQFANIVSALRELPCARGIFDGEIVALEESGRSSFQLLQGSRMAGRDQSAQICYYLFDLLNLEGKKLIDLPLSKRKEILQELLSNHENDLRFSATLHAEPDVLLEEIRSRGLEGLIAKKTDSKYESGRRTGAWVKIKCLNQQEFVIGGYTRPKGTRSHFGSLVVGYYQGARLMFASKVGTGFSEQLLTSLYKRFQELVQKDCPFVNLPEKRATYGGIVASEMKRCTWMKPELVCEVRFTEWTNDDHLRQPVFLGIREDKRPEEIIREV